jgi:hypothetical protein
VKELSFVKLSVEGMKHQILTALNTQHLDLTNAVNKACEKFIKEDLEKQVDLEIDRAIRDEIQKFFRFGDGSQFIAGIVKEKLNKSFNPRTSEGER